ncbi:MAG: TetR family transcriptional regulator [Eubacterium sp.]|nr:TetR family transcriptional regulator [Eubacterium sp.]
MSSKAKKAIINIFLDLIEENEYEKISVTMIVDACNISRQTFYYHFRDIEDMLKCVFKEESEKICNQLDVDNWHNSAQEYVGFFNRFDTALRKMLLSSDFVLAYNLIYKSFYEYIADYYISYQETRSAKRNEDGKVEFLISYTASAITGLVIAELQKSKSDYNAILNKLWDNFKLNKK